MARPRAGRRGGVRAARGGARAGSHGIRHEGLLRAGLRDAARHRLRGRRSSGRPAATSRRDAAPTGHGGSSLSAGPQKGTCCGPRLPARHPLGRPGRGTGSAVRTSGLACRRANPVPAAHPTRSAAGRAPVDGRSRGWRRSRGAGRFAGRSRPPLRPRVDRGRRRGGDAAASWDRDRRCRRRGSRGRSGRRRSRLPRAAAAGARRGRVRRAAWRSARPPTCWDASCSKVCSVGICRR